MRAPGDVVESCQIVGTASNQFAGRRDTVCIACRYPIAIFGRGWRESSSIPVLTIQHTFQMGRPGWQAAYIQDHGDMSATEVCDELETTIKALYAAISFSDGGEPDWQAMRALFHPSAILTRITPEGIDYFTLESFQAMAMEMLDRGVYTAFFEVEIRRSAQVFGSLAHVLSAYETKRSKQARTFLSRGINSIQLIRGGINWEVLSLLWDEETASRPLDLSRLFPIGGM